MSNQTINRIESEMKKTIDSYQRDLNSFRTGRASSDILQDIQVDYYGSKMPISQVAKIAVPEAQVITIQPWEKQMIQEIEKAIQKSDLGLNPANDGNTIRIPIPPLSEERRKELVKALRNRTEEFRVSIRAERRDGMNALKEKQKAGELSQDEERKGSSGIQTLHDKYIKKIDKMFHSKEQELLET